MNAWLLGMGMETLPLRMARHSQSGLGMARYLQDHPKVAWVRYPGLPGDKYYELAQKYLPKGASGVVSFGVKGGREAATKFMDGLEMASVVTHVADLRTCCLHPASTTHRQMSDEQLKEAGVAPDLIRLSVGIENVEDILADIDQDVIEVDDDFFGEHVFHDFSHHSIFTEVGCRHSRIHFAVETF